MVIIAIPKGRLGDEAVKLFKKAGIGDSINLESRKLLFCDNKNSIKFMLVKNADIISCVEEGIADLGVIGEDLIMENNPDLYELENLDIGNCKLAVAGLKGNELRTTEGSLRIATKFVNVSRKYFNKRGQKIEIIKLNGSIELAPILGLSDFIVDIVETGNTLKANGLEIIENMYDISGKLVSNKVSYKYNKKEIDNILNLVQKSRRLT